MPQEEVTPPLTIRWNQVTWYSKLGAIIVFLGVIPSLAFYVGVQSETVRELSRTTIIVPAPAALSAEARWVDGQYDAEPEEASQISVQSKSGRILHVTGEAEHQQLNGPHFGDLDVDATINSVTDNAISATYSDEDRCVINFLFQRYPESDYRGVAISDTGDAACGWGANVRFQGDYDFVKSTSTR